MKSGKKITELSYSKVNKYVQTAGTELDRRRKLTNAEIKYIYDKIAKGWEIEDIAETMGRNIATIKHYADPTERERKRLLYYKRKAEGKIKPTNAKAVAEELAEYKRQMVKKGKISWRVFDDEVQQYTTV